ANLSSDPSTWSNVQDFTNELTLLRAKCTITERYRAPSYQAHLCEIRTSFKCFVGHGVAPFLMPGGTTGRPQLDETTVGTNCLDLVQAVNSQVLAHHLGPDTDGIPYVGCHCSHHTDN